MKEKTKKDRGLKPEELAVRTGLRMSTINYWASLGLLPFEQAGSRLMRRYPRETLKRIREIRGLKRKGLTLPEIKERLKGEKER